MITIYKNICRYYIYIKSPIKIFKISKDWKEIVLPNGKIGWIREEDTNNIEEKPKSKNKYKITEDSINIILFKSNKKRKIK
jgi:SH3-like domain-containing protein